MLERIINTIDKQLSAYSSVKSSDLSIKIKDIRNNCNILCYRVALNDDELFSFVKNYLKYMECQKIFEINALEKYFDNRPMCDCGTCNQKCNVGGIRKGNFYWIKLRCGRNPGQKEWSKQAKITRQGKGNPMYGKSAWNKGKTKHNNPIMKQNALNAVGRITSEEAKRKQSISAKKRKIHGHTGFKHSQKTKDDSRIRTLQMIQDGKFKQTKTKPHIAMSKLLDSLSIEHIEEHIIDPWSFDFFVPKYSIYIEVDGDYFHSHPNKYPNGPETKTQKINHYRDQKKNKFCKQNNLLLYRFWECDILKDSEKVVCVLKKLFQSSPLE